MAYVTPAVTGVVPRRSSLVKVWVVLPLVLKSILDLRTVAWSKASVTAGGSPPGAELPPGVGQAVKSSTATVSAHHRFSDNNTLFF